MVLLTDFNSVIEALYLDQRLVVSKNEATIIVNPDNPFYSGKLIWVNTHNYDIAILAELSKYNTIKSRFSIPNAQFPYKCISYRADRLRNVKINFSGNVRNIKYGEDIDISEITLFTSSNGKLFSNLPPTIDSLSVINTSVELYKYLVFKHIMENFTPTIPYTWTRRVNPGEKYYEVSSKGDKRFSAFYAYLADGRSIEEAYQLDVKGYRRINNDPLTGKGKPPLVPVTDQPKITSYYLDFGKFNVSEELRGHANNCSKLITNVHNSQDMSKFVKIIMSANPNLINPATFEPDDIVLVLLDDYTKSSHSKEWQDALASLYEAMQTGVKSLVTITSDELSLVNIKLTLDDLVGKHYLPVGETGYRVNLYNQYYRLWLEWSATNNDLLTELAFKSHGIPLTDMFATSDINQARALSEILNSYYNLNINS